MVIILNYLIVTQRWDNTVKHASFEIHLGNLYLEHFLLSFATIDLNDTDGILLTGNDPSHELMLTKL